MIWYKVGAADETPGKSGLAHFLEHLMFKGTAKHPAGIFSQAVAHVGGQENAFTSNDYTAFYQRVPSEQLKTVMEFEADRMTGLQLTDQVVLPERNVILEAGEPCASTTIRARGLGSSDRCRAVPQPSLRQAGDRLATRDGAAVARRCHRLLSPLLRSQRHGGGDRRRRRAACGAQIGARHLRQGCPPRQYHAARASPAGAAAGVAALIDARRPRVEQPLVQRDYLVPSFAHRQIRQRPASRKRSKCSRIFWVTAPTAGSIAHWWWTSRSRWRPAPVTTAPRSTCRSSGYLARRAQGVTLPQLEAEPTR